MSWLFSQALVEEYLAANSLDGEQSVQSNGKPIQQAYCAPDKMTDFSRLSRFGMMFKPLTVIHGEELSMSSVVAFHVRTFQPLEKESASMESGQECGEKWRGWLAKFDPHSCSWRTAQCSLLGEEHELLQILPKWGMTRHGLLWELPMLAHHTNGTGCGFLPDNETFFHTPNTTGMDGGSNSRKALRKRLDLWPTPVHSEARQGLQIRRDGKKGTQQSLTTAVMTWPTPRTAGMCGGSGSWDLLNKNTTVEEARLMGAGNGGQLNPNWVEWLMGWPLGWTDLKPLATGKSHCVQQQHGES